MQHARSADNPKGPVVWPARCLQNFPSAASVLPPDCLPRAQPKPAVKIRDKYEGPVTLGAAAASRWRQLHAAPAAQERGKPATSSLSPTPHKGTQPSQNQSRPGIISPALACKMRSRWRALKHSLQRCACARAHQGIQWGGCARPPRRCSSAAALAPARRTASLQTLTPVQLQPPECAGACGARWSGGIARPVAVEGPGVHVGRAADGGAQRGRARRAPFQLVHHAEAPAHRRGVGAPAVRLRSARPLFCHFLRRSMLQY